jgi:tetratricopeptide (TPR) repeat protein
MEKRDQPKKAVPHGIHRAPHDQEIKPVDYLRAVKSHLRNGMQKDAYALLQQASIQFPNDPLILSYLGCFQAVIDKKHRTGVENCKKALVLLKKFEAQEKERLYPLFYLNLGRAFISAGKKKDAIESFNIGLKYDGSNGDLIKELRGLGARKQPPIPFLDRSNPINKYIGKFLHAKSGDSQKQKRQRASRS